MNNLITFETKCWEQDWEYIIKEGYEEKLAPFYGYKFANKHLIINNVKNLSLVCEEAEKLKSRGVIDNWYVVSNYENETLKFFNIERDSFIDKGADGYYYSIAELVSIYVLKTKYLLHFSSDSILKTNGSDWLSNSIELMETNNNLVCVTPYWHNDNSHTGIDYSCRFSDQCFFKKADVFKKPIYNTLDCVDGMFPKHGGNSFERRVYSYLYNNLDTQLIATDYNHYYHHYFRFPPRN